MIAGGS